MRLMCKKFGIMQICLVYRLMRRGSIRNFGADKANVHQVRERYCHQKF